MNVDEVLLLSVFDKEIGELFSRFTSIGDDVRKMWENVYPNAIDMMRENMPAAAVKLAQEDQLGDRALSKIAHLAAGKGYRDALYQLVNLGATDLEGIAYHAAAGGQSDIVFEMIRRGVRDLHPIALIAARSGHDRLLNELIEKGASRTDRYAEEAYAQGHMKIFRSLVDGGVSVDNLHLERDDPTKEEPVVPNKLYEKLKHHYMMTCNAKVSASGFSIDDLDAITDDFDI